MTAPSTVAWIRKYGVWQLERAGPNDPGDPEAPPSALASVPVELMFITSTGTTHTPSAGISGLTGRRTWWDLGPFTHARITAYIENSTMPVGGFIAFRGLDAAGTVLGFLDGVDGPRLAIDTAAVATWNSGTMKSLHVALDPGLRTDVVIQAVHVGGDGVGALTYRRLALQLVALSDEVPPPDGPTDPEGPGVLAEWLVSSACAAGTVTDGTGAWGVPVVVSVTHAGGVGCFPGWAWMEAAFQFAPNATVLVSGILQLGSSDPHPFPAGLALLNTADGTDRGAGHAVLVGQQPLDTNIPFSVSKALGADGLLRIRVGLFDIHQFDPLVTIRLTALAFNSPPLTAGPDVDDLLFQESFEA